MIIRKDLLKLEKSNARILLGIIFWLISMVYILDKTMHDESVSTFDWFYSCFFALIGILFIIEGYGIPVLRLFGKAFVLIDEDKIVIKTSIFSKEKNLRWNEIKSIDYGANNFLFIKENKDTLSIDLSKLNYPVALKINESISSCASKKGISIKRK